MTNEPLPLTNEHRHFLLLKKVPDLLLRDGHGTEISGLFYEAGTIIMIELKNDPVIEFIGPIKDLEPH